MRRLVLLLIIFGLQVHGIAAQQPQRLTVFAAASLADVMKAVDQAWTEQGHPGLRLSLAASSTLARQLDHGAHANLFASADEEWMNWAAARHLIDEKSRRNVASNQLVLIVPKEHPRHIDIKPDFDISD